MLGRIPFGVRPNVLPTVTWPGDPFQIFPAVPPTAVTLAL